MVNDSDPKDVISKVAQAYGKKLALVQKFAVGEYGAYEVVGNGGTHYVLKQSPNPEWYKQIERAKVASDILRRRGSPTSEYVFVSHDDFGTYWLQKRIDGEPISEDPTIDQLKQLVGWINLQRDTDLSRDQDWSRYVKSVIFEGESGWMPFLEDYSEEGAVLVSRIKKLTIGLENLELPVSDAVHGDFTCQQVLVKSGKITGIVDWDAVGCGDRGLDVATLLFDLYSNTDMECLLRHELLDVSGVEAGLLYLLYRTLNIAAWQTQEKSNQSAIKSCCDRLDYIEGTFRI